MLWIINAQYVKDYLIEVEFNNLEKGIVNFQPHLDLPIFKELNDINNFKKFKLNSWTIEWENGADFSPEYVFQQLNSQKL